MKNETVLMLYMLLITMVFMIYAQKPKDLVYFTGKLMAWMFFPLIFVIFALTSYIDKKRLKWLNKKWFVVSIQEAWIFLVAGFMN